MDPFRQDVLAGKTAFLAGGTSGINLGIAVRLSELGARVIVGGRDADKARRAAEEIGDADHALGLSFDVRDYAAVEESMAVAAAAFGAFDIVVSGAAGNFLAPALGMSANGFRTVVDIDLMGTFNVFRACHAHLNRPGASLIAITAGQAVQAMASQAHVGAAKAGINQLVRVLALEWGPDGVRVNAISPGPIADTEGMRRLTSTPKLQEALTRRIPLQRYGDKREIADAAVFLSTGAARYITGVILDVDGGWQLGAAGD